MGDAYNVVVWGTGMVGQYALRHILSRHDLRLVGLKCHSDMKVGRDAAEFTPGALSKTGIRATAARDEIIRLDADVVIFAPFDALADPSIDGSPSAVWIPDLEDLLRGGKNVLTPILSLTHWRHLQNGEAFRKRLNDAAIEGGVSLFAAGLDPGYTTDALAYAASTITSDITTIDAWEVLDYGSYEALDTVRMLGFGALPQDMSAAGLDTLRVCWGGALHALADSFGILLEDIHVSVDAALAKQSYVSQSGLEIVEGAIEAIKFRVAGVYRGRDVFGINHVTRMGPQSGPEFRRIGHDGGYALHIAGFPPVHAEFPFGYSEGTGHGWSDAMAMTSSRLVNGIKSIVRADPGWRLFHEMPGHGGQFALKLA